MTDHRLCQHLTTSGFSRCQTRMIALVSCLTLLSLIFSFSAIKAVTKLEPAAAMQMQAKDVPALRKDLPKEVLYLAKSTPMIIPGGTVVLRHKYLEIVGKECLGPYCIDKPIDPDNIVHIEGDVIVSYLSNHFFHFVFDTLLRLWGLHLHGALEKYANATILWYGDKTPPNKECIEMMKVIWPEFPMNKSIIAKGGTAYKVDDLSTMAMTRHNQYHDKNPWQDYNFWLLDSIRETMTIVHEPKDELFISRRGHRRGIAREDELYAALKSSILPKLRLVLPDDFSVAEQAQQFANAKLIIAPHGGSLTNAIFSNWDKMVLIELTKANGGGQFATYRMDLQVKQHYLLKCQSAPCNGTATQCDPWNTPIDINVQNATETIKTIILGKTSLQEEIFISTE